MNKREKIAFVMTSLEIGGAQKACVDLINHIDTKRYDISLFLLKKGGDFEKNLSDNINIHYILPKNSKFLKYIYTLFISLPAKNKYLNFLNIIYINIFFSYKKWNTIIAYMEGLPHFIVSNIKTTAKKIAWVHTDLHLNHYTMQYFKTNEREREILNKYNDIIFVSRESKENFILEFGEYKNNLHILYNVISKEKIIELSEEYDVPSIDHTKTINCLFVGRLDNIKRVDRIINASYILKSRNITNFKIRILGDGPKKDKLIDLTKEKGLDDIIKFEGFIANPYPYIKNSDIVINSSITEGYPISICEAMILGNAVICTKTTGSNEVLDYGKYGILTEHNSEDIANRLEYIILNNDILNIYKNKALEGAKNFNSQKIIEIFSRIIS